MRKLGHLRLVVNDSASAPQSVLSDAQISEIKARYSIYQRLKDAERELSSIREVTDASFDLLQKTKHHEFVLEELMDLCDMFIAGTAVLDAYADELKQISVFRLTPRDVKQFTRVRKLLEYLHVRVPDAAAYCSKLIKSMHPFSLPSKRKKRQSQGAVISNLSLVSAPRLPECSAD